MTMMPPFAICLNPTWNLVRLCILMPYIAPNPPISDDIFAPFHPIFCNVKIGSCQVKQSIQVVQAVDTNWVDVIAVAGLVTDR